MPRPARAGDAKTSVANAQAAERKRGRDRGRRTPPILKWSCKESARRALGFPIPIVRIRALRQPGLVDTAAVLGRVSLALADLLGERPEGTWATWETIDAGCYAEGELAPDEQPRATHPPLVSLLAFEGRRPELVERMLVCVAETLARELDLEPGNVFVTYEEARAGRLYQGGGVISG